ncbi:hypothetical protein [Thiobacillus sp.]|uniref:tetratricopeptide repeat protein n=1 Tax=Thiobacillus sp. TaxID=924 RepID=UPI00286DEEC6|nr:hypothetical protein [Thiobacillus sp.]
MHFSFNNRLTAALIGCCILAINPLNAEAEVLGEMQVQPDNYENLIRVQFNARIQFLRAVPVGKSNTVLVYFRIVQSDDQVENKSVESRKTKPFERLPGITATLSPQVGKVNKLSLQIGTDKIPANMKVRAGTNGRSIDIMFGDKLIKHQTGLVGKRYALTLLKTESKSELGRVIPREFQDYEVFTSQQTRDGRPLYELNLGYFATPEQAEQVRAKLVAQFPEVDVIDLLKRREETLKAASGRAEPTFASPEAPLPEVEDQSASLMAKAQEALKAANYELAITGFNQVLLLPPNKNSQEAQELIGLARERNGELAKAKAEYEIYLKQFPDGAGADRVRQQLAQLAVPAPGAPKAKRRDETVIKTVSGSFSQFYYGGSTQTQTAFDTPTTPVTSTLSTTDQSELRSNLDLTGRYRNADADQKLVFRDDNVISFLDTRPNRNRVLAAYYSYKGLENGFSSSIGRQTGTSGGVLGRFDGAQVGYSFAPKWRINAVAGLPVEFPALETDRNFWGMSLDADELTERLHGKTYFINQTGDGILDRRAVGMELGYYFDARGTAINALIDYDVSYDALNIGALTGSWQTEGGSSLSFTFEQRRAPSLATSNALYNSAVTAMSPVPTSIKQLLATSSEEQIRQWAEDVSAITEQYAVGFLTPLNENWQVGGDVNLTNTGALPGQTLDDGTVLPPTPATGNIYTYSLRAIGSGLLRDNDVNVFTLSLNQGDTYHGELFAFNNTTRIGAWTLEPSLKYYQQQTDPATDLTRWTPEFHLIYQLKGSLSLEADYTYEHSKTTSPGSSDVSQQHFFYAGYRWDI